jgi:hypothetical protein
VGIADGDAFFNEIRDSAGLAQPEAAGEQDYELLGTGAPRKVDIRVSRDEQR